MYKYNNWILMLLEIMGFVVLGKSEPLKTLSLFFPLQFFEL